MSHELESKPEHIYDQYTRAEERIQTIKQIQRELPNLALEDVQEMAKERQKALKREIDRRDVIVAEAKEYAAVNLPELKEQATSEARSEPFNKTINPV